MTALTQLSENDFAQVRKLIHDRVGIKLGDSKRAMVVSRLSRRLRELKFDNFPDYLNQLNDPAAEEWQFFTNALTTNLTSFFREAHHFDVLKQALEQGRQRRPFRIWCAAASTGEEPYSIAMTVAETGSKGPSSVEIIASDVDTQVLAHAARGVYPLDRIQSLDKAQVRKFFLKGKGPNEGLCRIRPQWQKNIQFQQINLLDSVWPVPKDIDVIFCRNVMIYFDKPTQRRLVEHFLRHMGPQSLFITGHSESLYHCTDMLRSLGRTVYRPLTA